MDLIEEQIENAVRTLNLSEEQFRKCDPESSERVAQRVQDTFVRDSTNYWRMSLLHPFECFDYSDGFGFEDLSRHVPPGNDKCWFIPETEDQYPPVYETDVACISRVLGECSCFVYYLVGKQYDWLITENDHNQLIVSQILGKPLMSPS